MCLYNNIEVPATITGKLVGAMSVAMDKVMNKNVQFFIVVGIILIILTVLFLCFGHLKHDREKGLALNAGADEQTRGIQNELDEYRTTNMNQQLGLLAVGLVIVLVAAVWWVGQTYKSTP